MGKVQDRDGSSWAVAVCLCLSVVLGAWVMLCGWAAADWVGAAGVVDARSLTYQWLGQRAVNSKGVSAIWDCKLCRQHCGLGLAIASRRAGNSLAHSCHGALC